MRFDLPPLAAPARYGNHSTTTTTTTTPPPFERPGPALAARPAQRHSTATRAPAPVPPPFWQHVPDGAPAARGDQQAVSSDQQAVSTDESNLAEAHTLGRLQRRPNSTTNTTSTGTSTRARRTRASSIGSHAEATGSGGRRWRATDTPEQIATDQAAIDSAEATLIEAQQSLAEAQLTSPINGTIASVGIAVGDTVTANSSTEVIVIIGTQSYEVSATLTSGQVAR